MIRLSVRRLEDLTEFGIKENTVSVYRNSKYIPTECNIHDKIN